MPLTFVILQILHLEKAILEEFSFSKKEEVI